ncbi:Variant surface glycoprotein [Trypanosoma congolense IL3000]|uniref:Variant surface glycoprotein n=1 Tax=Trypanosoma congolense (strain IL3000) TaxID=1068625 RepID=F9W4C2_TRYCI|nr:Variant surface glycoprotein [Trypanosoma congolense IL3000]
MMGMKFWIMIIIFFFMVDANGGGKEYNKNAYNALCDLLQASVRKWDEVMGRKKTDTLRKALRITIFGSKGSEDLDALRRGLPEDYKKGGADRNLLCGQQYRDYNGLNQPRWSGYSGLHDLFCLCTPGESGWPINVSGNTLCGQENSALEGGMKGWYKNTGGEVKVEKTWNTVTEKCLRGRGDTKGLKDALTTFMGELCTKNSCWVRKNSYQLGEGIPTTWSACDGTSSVGVCVAYYNATNPMPWWSSLKEAINADEQEQKKREKEEQKKKEVQKREESRKQENTELPQGPRTAALRSATLEVKEADQNNPENISYPLETLEEASGAIIAQPCSWLLNAIFL